ncbi:delta-type opioid receptor-like [Kryptolebias marmoratus]|uniref:Si:dkey-148a17.5 n=1 Tax=Kryptolebias marmoratus TaxID=37003 RepID=A0A3Q3B5M7_KRYMA|nr:delta-type opioid receptor-like [Kryptolebias marmoratus]
MNSSSEPSHSKGPAETDGGTIAACVILGLAFLIGAPGNLLVIWTILRYVKRGCHTVVLLLHLAAADLLILITLPLWIYSLLRTWVFGEIVCKLFVHIDIVCMFSSIFFITLMSVERFLAICHPFLMMRLKSERIMNGCLLFLWLLALLLGVPVFITQTLDKSDGDEQCFSREFTSTTQAITFLCLETLLGFVFPLITLSVCYCLVAVQLKKMSFKSKQMSKSLINAVVILFILCWLPYHIVNVIDVLCIQLSNTEHECVPKSLIFSTGALVFISSSVNPVLYAFFARSFRGGLGESYLVKLFQEVAANTHKLWEHALQQQPEGSKCADRADVELSAFKNVSVCSEATSLSFSTELKM